MAREVKWIKMDTGLPDSRKIKQIRKLPNGDSIALMWVFLMCLAGETNENGMIYFTPEIPYTDEMLADEFSMEINTVRLALTTFQRFGMIEIIDNIICLSSWEKYQSVDKLSEIREYNRIAKQKSRAKQKLLLDVNDKSMTSQPCQDIDIEEDKEEREELYKIGRSKKKVPKNKYGEYNNVLLTENEFENLANSFGIALRDQAIKFLDEYIEEKGYKSKSHNMAIRRWVIDAVSKNTTKKPANGGNTAGMSQAERNMLDDLF